MKTKSQQVVAKIKQGLHRRKFPQKTMNNIKRQWKALPTTGVVITSIGQFTPLHQRHAGCNTNQNATCKNLMDKSNVASLMTVCSAGGK